jgi:hypothetical protein
MVIYKSLGPFPGVSVREARADAQQWIGKAAKWKQTACPVGENPFVKKAPTRKPHAAPLLSELVDRYVEGHLRDPKSEISDPSCTAER